MSNSSQIQVVYVGPARSYGQRRVDEESREEIPDIRQFLYPGISTQQELDFITARGHAHGNFIFRRNGSGVKSFYFSPKAHPVIVTQCHEFLAGESDDVRAQWLDRELPQAGILGGDICCDSLGKIRVVQFGYYCELMQGSDLMQVFKRVKTNLFSENVWVLALTDTVSVALYGPNGRKKKIKPLAQISSQEDMLYLVSTAILLDEKSQFFYYPESHSFWPGILGRDKNWADEAAWDNRITFQIEDHQFTSFDFGYKEEDTILACLSRIDKSRLAQNVTVERSFSVKERKRGKPISSSYRAVYSYNSKTQKLKAKGKPQFMCGLYLED